MSGFGGSRLLLCPSATASKARARATCAAGALCDRPSRDRATRSASRNGRSGSFCRLDIGHLAIRQSAIMAHRKASDPLGELGYSCQANRKTREGTSHPDRDAQSAHIDTTVRKAIAAGEPAISVDTKKKELVGDFRNPGRELRPRGDPEQVRVHDFKIPELGKVAPYGVYDIAANQGWVNVGIDADTAAFAVESIRRWWERLGRARYPEASRLVITADCGGSNGARVRLWKRELQRFANETGLAVTVLPPGTSKWNRIEHRLFAYISQNWRGKPLVSHQVVIQLIGATTTQTGLTVRCEIDA